MKSNTIGRLKNGVKKTQRELCPCALSGEELVSIGVRGLDTR